MQNRRDEEREREKKINKKSKQLIVIERYEILQKAKKLKAKEIKYKDIKEILGVKKKNSKELENFTQKISNMRVLYLKSKKPNKIVEKRILNDIIMLRIIL